MKKINNLEELQYRKLYLRARIRIKEIDISRKFDDLEENLRSPAFRFDVARNMISNPTLTINTARVVYDIVQRIWNYRKNKNHRKKNSG